MSVFVLLAAVVGVLALTLHKVPEGHVGVYFRGGTRTSFALLAVPTRR